MVNIQQIYSPFFNFSSRNIRFQPKNSIVDTINAELPDCIHKILKETGFDSEDALLELNDISISIIEEFVQQDRIILKESIYENREPFKFLPGHRVLLLAIPKKINNLKVTKKHKTKQAPNRLQSIKKNCTSSD